LYALGIKGIDLVGPEEWPISLVDSPMCNGAEINLIDGFNDIKFHDTLIKNTEMIPLVANAGFKILFALAEIKEIKQTKKD
jgi:hydroxypyruvate isomerase